MSSYKLEKLKLPPGYKPGKWRPFHVAGPSSLTIERTTITRFDHFLTFVLLALSILIRLYNIPFPNKVIFDETHFGGFARSYFRGEFFVDVHPPLAKLMYYSIAILCGWNGDFEFAEIGDTFDDNVPYVAMRLFSGICGVLTVLLTFGILRASNCRSAVAFFGAFLVLIENSLVTQSRLIMLDGPLIFGVALSVLGFKRFQLAERFTKKWFKFLIMTGIGLGITMSIKLTGLFTVAWVGVLTVIQLWSYLGDLEVSDRQWFKHVYYRVFGLIVVPLTIYLGCFAIHFINLPFNGPGSGAVSPSFKATFHDSQDLKNTPVDVSYGSTVTIKHKNMESYLHSHDHTYYTGSHEQQVTLYGFDADENNEWIIETKNKSPIGQLQGKFRPVKDGDIVRLYHKSTGKYLTVNEEKPPISERDYSNEVACSGDRDMLGNENYEFKVRIVKSETHATLNLPMIKVRATETLFQLVHRSRGCVVIAHEDKLPDWGFNQNEVLCIDEPTIPNTMWYIEHNSHPMLDNDSDAEKVHFKSYSFFNKLVEYHLAMWRINKSFTDKHPYSSSPESWPFLLRGINFFSNEAGSSNELHDEDGSHIYLLGNVAIYYVGFILISLVIAKNIIKLFKVMNPFGLTYDPPYVSTFQSNGFEFVVGWMLHYFPSYQMSRQLFLHHYLSSLFFSILVIAQVTEYQMTKRKIFGYIWMVSITVLAIYCFVAFTPIIYGFDWNRSECNHAKWFPSWDFNCMSYTH